MPPPTNKLPILPEHITKNFRVGNDPAEATLHTPVDKYVFPSQKKMAKFPVIHIAGDSDRFITWITDHPEIDNRVPPIYQNFIVEAEDTRILVCYTDDSTCFYAKAWRVSHGNEKYISSISIDYNECVDGKFRLNHMITPHAPAGLAETNWFEKFSMVASTLVIGVQAYMLYHKPELVEQIYTPGESHPTRSKKHKVTAQPIKIRKTKIKRITLTEDDTPKKEIHYNKLSWHVRGHYRHVGKDKHLVYIQPTIHNRNGKKYSVKGQTYELTED